MPLARMGDGLGVRRPGLLSRLFTTTLPRLDPSRFGLADYDFYGGAVDFQVAKANGVRRPIIRVGQGYYGIDPQFHASAAHSKGLFSRDFYWMLDSHQSANGQATQCASELSIYGQLDPDSILWADFELSPVNVSFLYGFLTTLHNLLGLRLGIYTGYSYWQTYGSTDPSWTQYPLWISWPVSPYREPVPLKPWSTYYYHQWTFAGDGVYYGQQSAGLDLDYLNPLLVSGTAVVVKRNRTQYHLDATPSTIDVLPLKYVVQQATENGWEAAMNGGCGFTYTDATHALVKGTNRSHCVTYSTDSAFGYYIADNCTWLSFARRMIDQGAINPNLDNTKQASQSMLGFDSESIYLIVTKGREGIYGLTQLQAARYAQSLGITELYLMDSGHSSSIEENGQLLYSEYGEPVPQAIGLKSNGGSMTTQAQELLGKTVTVRSSPQVISGNGTAESVAPHAIVSYVNIVDDLQHQNDANYKWLQLDTAATKFVNYIYPPNGLRFTLLAPPPPQPQPSGTVVTLKSWDVVVNVDGQDFEFKGP